MSAAPTMHATNATAPTDQIQGSGATRSPWATRAANSMTKASRARIDVQNMARADFGGRGGRGGLAGCCGVSVGSVVTASG
jgi:hypothetical protein